MTKTRTILSILTCMLCLLAVPGVAHANEGKFSIGTTGVTCEGISIWQTGSYRITGICNGLVYPYHDQQDRYILWVQPDAGGNPVIISQIEKGVISGATANRFTGIFITAESNSGPRTPSATRIASGNLSLFNFPLPYQNQGSNQAGNGNQPQPTPTVTPTKAPAKATTPTPTPAKTITPKPATSSATIGNFTLDTKTILALAPIVIIVLVILGIALLFRR